MISLSCEFCIFCCLVRRPEVPPRPLIPFVAIVFLDDNPQNDLELTTVWFNRIGHPGGHYCNYKHGALSSKSSHCNLFEDGTPIDKINFSSTDAQSSNDLFNLQMTFTYRLYMAGYRDSSSSIGCQVACPITSVTVVKSYSAIPLFSS